MLCACEADTEPGKIMKPHLVPCTEPGKNIDPPFGSKYRPREKYKRFEIANL
jgi:hypothetical protein